MSRKAKSFRREYLVDPVYKSVKITKFINRVMLHGKKSIAQTIVYSALEQLGQKVNENPYKAFEQSLKNVMPVMEVKSRRVGGSTYQVPTEVRPERAFSLALRWIVDNARKRSGRSMVDDLANELSDAFNNTGTSVKKKEETHKMAESNKAFAHFRW